jgi:CheY-like chemotaxis protein
VAGPLTDKQAELLHAAREDCDRLQGMVDDLLDLSRIESGRIELFPLPTAVSHLIESAVEEHKSEADAAGINLSAAFPLPEARVLADHERIGHVFSNLIGNAVSHTPNGGSVTLGARIVNGAVRFTVADTGKGIAREYHERIFEKFFRVPDARPRGTGLGLYMTETQPRILVVDDERNIRRNLTMVLEAAGYQVDEAGDGEEALESCKRSQPDIAFVDLHMAKMEGLEVLAHIKALSPKTAVVIITAYGSAANAAEAMKLGAVDFLEKPFDPKIIAILAEEILFRQRLGAGGSFDDLMHLADLARERGANLEARGYLKAAMSRAFDRPEPYYWLGFLSEKDGDQKMAMAIQYYYMALSANRNYEPATGALKRLGRIH